MGKSALSFRSWVIPGTARHGRRTCSSRASLRKPAGRASRMLSRLTPSRLLRSIMSLLPAKKAAAMTPARPPRTKIQKFVLLPCLVFAPCFSVCSFSAVMTRRFPGRSFSGSGVGSREKSGEETWSSFWAAPKRRRRKDMNCYEEVGIGINCGMGAKRIGSGRV